MSTVLRVVFALWCAFMVVGISLSLTYGWRLLSARRRGQRLSRQDELAILSGLWDGVERRQHPRVRL